MTKEHLGLALALNVPVFVVVTKIDMCPANILQGESYRLSPGLFWYIFYHVFLSSASVQELLRKKAASSGSDCILNTFQKYSLFPCTFCRWLTYTHHVKITCWGLS